MRKLNNNVLLLIIVISSIFLVGIILNNKIVMSEDISFHMVRMESLARNLKNGIFLPSIQTDNNSGMGYFVDVFYPNFWIWPGAILRILKLPIVICFSLNIIWVTALAIFINFKLISFYLKDKIYALKFLSIHHTFYMVTAPSFVIGNIGVYISFLFLPLIYYGLKDLYQNKRIVMLVIGVSCILEANVLMFAVACGFVAIYALVYFKETKTKEIIVKLLQAIGVSIGVNSAFLIPFIYYYLTEDIHIKNQDFFISHLSRTGNIYLGIIIFSIVVLISIAVKLIITKSKSNDLKLYNGILLILNGLACFAFYKTDCLRSIGLGYRILCFLPCFFAVGVTEITTYKRRKYIFTIYHVLSIIFIMVVAINYSTYFKQPAEKNKIDFAFNENYYLFQRTITIIDESYVPEKKINSMVTKEYLPDNFDFEIFDSISVETDDYADKLYESVKRRTLGKIKNYSYTRDGNISILELKDSDVTEITLPITYYSNYKATYNGNPVKVTNNNGLINISDVGLGTIKVWFSIHPIQWISFGISLLFILAILAKSIKLYQLNRDETINIT